MAFTRSPVYATVRTPFWTFAPVVPKDGSYASHTWIFGVDPGTPPPRVIAGFNSGGFNSAMFGGDRPPYR